MKKLYKHRLIFDLAWNYVQEQLKEVNTLSTEILNFLNFEKGYFFTLLPDTANLEEIYHFKWGGILPQYPEEELIINECKFHGSKIPNLCSEISTLLLDEVKMNDFVCIFDDVTCPAESLKGYSLFKSNGFSFNNESYYFLNKNNISHEKIVECLKNSTSFWHSLNLLTTYIDIQPGIINLDKINMMCKKTQSVMVGAYDGEGYVFWEKENLNSSLFTIENL